VLLSCLQSDELCKDMFMSRRERFSTTQKKFDSLIVPAKQAIAFYEAQIKATKDAMRAWTLVGIHFNVVKDIRKLIAKLIWDSREEALFK
jgi:hypothetical protein